MSWSITKRATPGSLVQAIKEHEYRPAREAEQKQADRLAEIAALIFGDADGLTGKAEIDFSLFGHATDGAVTGFETGCTGGISFSVPGK